MIRLGCQRFVALSVAILGGAAFGGDIGLGIGFLVIGVMAVAALIGGVRTKRPEHGGVWWLLATGLVLFMTGGIVGELTRKRVLVGGQEGQARNFPERGRERPRDSVEREAHVHQGGVLGSRPAADPLFR